MTGVNDVSSAQPTSMLRDAADILICAGGIYGCYLGYGVLQEQIFGTPRGHDGERFHFSWLLVLIQCMFNSAAAFIMGKIAGATASKVPMTEYARIAFTYIAAMVASNAALAYVDYPTQVLSKSVKIIPVMLMRILVNGKRYKLRDYVCVLLLTLGIAVFMGAKPSKGKGGGADNSPLGVALLCLSLLMDAFTGPTQERVRNQYQPSQHHMMLYMNLFALVYISAALGLTGELAEGVAFVQRHPAIVKEIVIFSACSAVGQNFIMHTVFRFNSLVLTTVTTTRKFFTIMGSVILFGNQLNNYQWAGVALVFTGLGLEVWHKYLDKKEKTKLKQQQQKKAM